MPGESNEANRNNNKEDAIRDMKILQGIDSDVVKSEIVNPNFIYRGVHKGAPRAEFVFLSELCFMPSLATVLPDINDIVTIRYVARSTGNAWLQTRLAERNPDRSLCNLLLNMTS
jgi:hypothetical protein